MNRLRHSAATEIRRQFELEAAQVTLGHATADVSQIYAERDLTLAVEIMRKIGQQLEPTGRRLIAVQRLGRLSW